MLGAACALPLLPPPLYSPAAASSLHAPYGCSFQPIGICSGTRNLQTAAASPHSPSPLPLFPPAAAWAQLEAAQSQNSSLPAETHTRAGKSRVGRNAGSMGPPPSCLTSAQTQKITPLLKPPRRYQTGPGKLGRNSGGAGTAGRCPAVAQCHVAQPQCLHRHRRGQSLPVLQTGSNGSTARIRPAGPKLLTPGLKGTLQA